MQSVLIVDDSEVDRRLAGGLLTKSGRYTVQFAGNGTEALAMLRNHRPDVVLTDLHMPDRGGLVVIQACRLHHENLPVILMTGQGSESMAVEALRAGAASYVAKAVLADRLVETLDDVLSHARDDETARRLLGHLMQSTFVFELENNPELISPLIDMTEQMLCGLKLCDRVDCMRVGSALKELLLATMYRGNLELPAEAQLADSNSSLGELQAIARRRAEPPYAQRLVNVELAFQPGVARFTVRHQGAALWNSSMLSALHDDQLEDPAMRPIVLMRAFCDDVLFGPGSDVTLVKHACDKAA